MKKSELSAYFKKMGQKGGAARKAKLSPERRSEIARNAGRQKGQAKRDQVKADPPADK